MRCIVKGIAPASYDAWKAQANKDWTPSYDTLPNPQKRDLHEALLAEQGHVCCYCGRRINVMDSHIEHFRPREHYPELELEFSNLHASCLRATTVRQSLHCGHAKGSAFDEALHISPLSEDCEDRFTYTLDGSTITADSRDAAAPYMIDLLRLNVPFLRTRRAEALIGAFDNAFIADATNAELRALRDQCAARDELGQFGTLSHVIARYAVQLLADDVAESSPTPSESAT
jgi:uncharacterized protein (TIGR02646 family)